MNKENKNQTMHVFLNVCYRESHKTELITNRMVIKEKRKLKTKNYIERIIRQSFLSVMLNFVFSDMADVRTVYRCHSLDNIQWSVSNSPLSHNLSHVMFGSILLMRTKTIEFNWKLKRNLRELRWSMVEKDAIQPKD